MARVPSSMMFAAVAVLFGAGEPARACTAFTPGPDGVLRLDVAGASRPLRCDGIFEDAVPPRRRGGAARSSHRPTPPQVTHSVPLPPSATPPPQISAPATIPVPTPVISPPPASTPEASPPSAAPSPVVSPAQPTQTSSPALAVVPPEQLRKLEDETVRLKSELSRLVGETSRLREETSRLNQQLAKREPAAVAAPEVPRAAPQTGSPPAAAPAGPVATPQAAKPPAAPPVTQGNGADRAPTAQEFEQRKGAVERAWSQMLDLATRMKQSLSGSN